MIEIPKSALTRIIIPKEKFYEVGDVSGKIKRIFIDEVEKVTLFAVIAPRTLNITGKTYEELDILEVRLKLGEVSLKVLETIDSIIPRPVLFCIVRPSGDIKYAISYKEPKTKEANKSKIIQYYETSWKPSTITIKGASVESIYINFIKQIDPNFDPSMPISDAVQKTKETAKIKNDIDKINSQIRNEPSIAKKQELARERFALEQQRNEL